MNKLLIILERLMAKPYLYKINKFMYLLAIKGMGIDNTYSLVLSGEKKLVARLLKNKRNPTILDVGANVGNYAANVLSLKPEAILHAFEPHPKTFLSLKESADKYGFTIVNMGCADVTGQLDFYDYANNDGSEHASLLEGVFTDLHQNQTVKHQVKVIKLDDYIQSQGLAHIDLLKIDTEGFEYQVLNGCKQTIDAGKISIIQFEFNSMNIIGKVFMKDFIHLLPQYDFFRVLPDGLLKIEQEKTILTEVFGFQNIVAINKKIAHEYL